MSVTFPATPSEDHPSTPKRRASSSRADLVVFPELSVCGYPPEDLLLHAGLQERVQDAVDEIRDTVAGISVLVGFPEYDGDDVYNACTVFRDGMTLAHYRKQKLPNYSVFDEERYFQRGDKAAVFKINGVRLGLTICEDVWGATPIAASRAAGAECIISINGSPYETASQVNRETVVLKRVAESRIPALYVNMVGGQDELVSMAGLSRPARRETSCFVRRRSKKVCTP